MVVGTDIGNTYKGQMGTGFSVINQYDPKYDLALRQERDRLAAAEKEAKQKRLDNAYEQLGKIKPDNWYVHDEQIKAMMNGLVDLGASLIQKGEDPYRNPEFNKLLIENTRMNEYSKQYQKNFEDIQKAYKNGEELDNWDEVAEYATNPDLIGMVNGDYGKAPKPIFKKPEISTFKTMNEYWDRWRINNKERVPSMQDATMMATELLSDPTVAQGFSSTGSKFQQRFNDLPKESREALAARGASNGGRDGYTQYVAEQMYALSNPNFNQEEEVMKLAKQVETSTSKTESGDVTTESKYAKMSDKDMRKVVRSTLQDGAVQKEVAAGKYGNPNKDIAFNLKAAEDYYLPLFKKNISTGYSRTEDEAGKASKAEDNSKRLWLDDIRGKNGKAAQDNARGRLIGAKLPGGEVTLTFGDESNPDAVGNVITLATEKTGKDDEGSPTRTVTGTPINVKTATDEELLRYYDMTGKRGYESVKKEDTSSLYDNNATTTESLY